MRDLTSRLREIVRRERATPAGSDSRDSSASEVSELRTLTYVPDTDDRRPVERVARDLGATPIDASGACLAIDRVWTSDRSHGRRRIESMVLGADAPLHLFDPRLAGGGDDRCRRVVFFDIETTGLSGGAGTLAFLVGCAWFEEEGLRVRQFFLCAPSGERAMLDALGRIFDDASLLVTFNGRTFDVPFMETRWAFHRASAPTDDLPHMDMLPPARRLWRDREEGAGPCNLASLERSVLAFHRLDDVPGLEIPARYFQFLRTANAAVVEGVLEHNRHDLVSLAAITAHALWLVQEGPDACREPSERVAIGRIYERAGDTDRAQQAYEMAAETGNGYVRRQALSRLAVLFRRADRHDDAARAWQGVLDLADRRQGLTPIERRAAEALAIHHEHRARNPMQAKRYAEVLPGRDAAVQHRLARLGRKISAAGNEKGGPKAARLFQT